MAVKELIYENIRICHVTSVHSWNDIRIFQKECVSLANFGYNVHLLVANSPFEGESNGVNVHSCDIGKRSRVERMRKSAQLMKDDAFLLDADLYHLHDPELLPLGKALIKKGKKVIFDAHEDAAADLLEKDLFPKPIRGIMSGLYNWYEKNTAKSFSGLISVSEEITKSFNHPLSETIKNYPVLSLFSKVQKNKDEEDPFIIYAGGLTRVRGIKEIILSMKYLPDYKLVLAGPFDSDSFKNECTELEQWNQVDYVGYIPLEKVYELLSRASLGFTMLYPTEGHIHSLPIKTFEYMAAGIPVLMTDMPYWREIFGDYGNYANVYDPKEIGQKAKVLLNKEDNSQIQKAKEMVFNKFEWEKEAAKLDRFYQKVLKS